MSLSPNMSSDPLSQRPAIGQFLNAGLFWLIVATLGALAFFWNGIDALLVAWQLPEYSHGPLIPLLSLLLFLRQLKTEPVHLGPQRDRWPGVVLLIVAMGFGMLGNFSGIDDVVAYALILWVGAILLISFGWQQGKHFWPPVRTWSTCCRCPGCCTSSSRPSCRWCRPNWASGSCMCWA